MGGVEAASKARQLLSQFDGRLGQRSLEGRVIISELVTNAWRHGHGRDDRPIEVTIRSDHERIEIEVRDQGPGFDPNPDNTRGDDDAGFGLVIVTGLADAWGVRRNGHVCVWALIESPGA